MLLLEALVSFAVLTQLLVNKLCISAVLDFVLLDESINKVIEVVVETSHFVLHVFLEGDSPHFDFVDEASENC